MGEIKSVKVDNWGVFFLQKLQNFFNKTDYCDLTLQFRDNSQLKVHRLVLSACTDYFNVLEQTCEVVDDAIIMPNGLQADVVVPIVNFMYTGTLEFELKMYNRLLRTAKDMNMTVLLKLLEAHRRTMEMHPPKGAGQTSPKPRRRAQVGTSTANSSSNAGGRSLVQSNQGNKRHLVGASANTQQNRSVLANSATARPPTVRQIGSTTFTRIKMENEEQETKSSMITGGYSLIKQIPQQPTSPFEQLRKGYNNNKRPAVTTFVSPPAKKPNLEDVKEFAEQQRMRKQIAAEYGDDDYDASNIMDDDTIHNDDDDDEMMASSGQNQASQTIASSTSAGVQTLTTASQQTQVEDPPGTTTIIVKHEGPDKPPTIVVKDSSNSKMNHAKIISEVLRQYPHLVKSNKNIKLKIMPNSGGQSQKIIVKKETVESEKQLQPAGTKSILVTKTLDSQSQSAKTLASNIVANRPKTIQQHQVEATTTTKQNASVLQTSISKPNLASSSANAQPAGAVQQKRRIDSKTMHALIALGAENTTGPWLCLRCGRNGHPISIPSYRGFRRHLINTHKEVIDPALCEHCGWRSSGKRELHFHMQMEHKIRTSLYIFPECQLCLQMCIDSDGLNQHLIESHPDENKQQCIYCNKIFPEELQLYTHMKTFHKKQALEDGIIDYSDDENQSQMALPPLPPMEYDQEIEQEEKEGAEQKKVKILSDISLPIASSIVNTESFGEQTANAAEEYLQEHDDTAETKFVAADGSEVILTAEQRKEILSQLNQEHDGSGVVMVLNEGHQQQQYSSSEIQSDHGAISQDENSQTTTATNEEREEEAEEHVAEEDDQHDDNQIYNEMKSLHSNLEDSNTQSEVEAKQETLLQEGESDHEKEDTETEMEHEEGAEHIDESKESMDNLEWAENLLSEHDLADDTPETEKEIKQEEKEEIKDDSKSQDEISKKLKELTGDWSEDDDDEDMMAEEPAPEMSPLKKTDTKTDTPGAEHKELEEQENKEAELLTKDKEESMEFEDHAELLASLQSADKDDIPKQQEKTETAKDDCENIDEDDIDMALKSLHREDEEEKKEKAIEPEYQKETNESEQEHDVTESKLPESKDSKKIEDNKDIDTSEATKKEDDGDEERPEEKLLKELETINEPEVTSSAMEVEEERKKDLIERLLSEQVETMENTANETPQVSEAIRSEAEKLQEDLEMPIVDKKHQDQCEASEAEEINLEDAKETKDIPKEKDISSSENTDIPSADSAGSTTDAVATKATTEVSETTGEVTEAASSVADAGDEVATSTKGENISTEDRVKSLISDWGDDDDDEDDNDADLTANL